MVCCGSRRSCAALSLPMAWLQGMPRHLLRPPSRRLPLAVTRTRMRLSSDTGSGPPPPRTLSGTLPGAGGRQLLRTSVPGTWIPTARTRAFFTLSQIEGGTPRVLASAHVLLIVGTVDFQARIHKYIVHFRPYYGAGPVGGVQLIWQYVDSLLLSDYRGVPTTG